MFPKFQKGALTHVGIPLSLGLLLPKTKGDTLPIIGNGSNEATGVDQLVAEEIHAGDSRPRCSPPRDGVGLEHGSRLDFQQCFHFDVLKGRTLSSQREGKAAQRLADLTLPSGTWASLSVMSTTDQCNGHNCSCNGQFVLLWLRPQRA